MNDLSTKLSSTKSHLLESCERAVEQCVARQKFWHKEDLWKWTNLEPVTVKGTPLSQLLRETEARGRLLIAEPGEWERRGRPGLDLHWHCRRLADSMMAEYLPRLQAGQIRPDDVEGEHFIEAWFCIPTAKALTKLDETIRGALIAAGSPSENAERILQCLVRREFAGVHVVVMARDEDECESASYTARSWNRSHAKLRFIVALDRYDLTQKQLQDLGHKLEKYLMAVQLLPAPEDALRQHFLDLVQERTKRRPNPGESIVDEEAGAEEKRLALAMLVLPAMQRVLTLEKSNWHQKRSAQTFKTLLEMRNPEVKDVVKALEKKAEVASHAEMQEVFDDAVWESFHQQGGSFVPVLARGLNELCGIPVNSQVADYLVFVAWKCLNDEVQPDKTGWPGNPSRKELTDAREGVVKLLSEGTERWRRKAAHQTILYALSDLFRRKEKWADEDDPGGVEEGGEIPRPRYWPSLLIAICQQPSGGPNRELVESFHRRLTADAQPHALHVRLVHLVRPLRVRAIIDMVGGGVLEKALRSCGRRFRTVRSTTPAVPPSRDHDAVNDLTVVEWTSSVDRSLILNFANPGNTEATPEEVNSLLSWLGSGDEEGLPPQNLLLIGVTDNEWWRTALEQLLPRMGENERVFLVTESNAVRDDLVRKFKNYVTKSRRLFIRVASHPDVLLYELYLRTTHTLPPAVHEYSFQHSMPPQPMPVAFDRQRDFEVRVEELVKVVLSDRHLTEWEKRKKAGEAHPLTAQCGRHPDHRRLIWTHGRAGVTAVASRAYKELAHQGSRCIWLGLNDFGSSSEVERYIVHQLSAMVGATSWAAIALASEQPLKMFLDIITSNQQTLWPLAFDSAHWVVFIEARGIPGLDAGVSGPILWSREELLKLEKDVILLLASRSVHVVYMPMSASFGEKLVSLMRTYSRSLYDQLVLDDKQPEDIMPVGDLLPPNLDPGESNEDSVENLIKSAIEWISAGEEEARWRRTVFLYSLSLFRESRHLSAITTDAIHYPLDWLGRLFEAKPAKREKLPISLHEFATTTEPRYRKELRDLGIIRWQRGGFVHMPWLLREAVRQLLEHGREEVPGQAGVPLPRSPDTKRPLTASKPAVHFRISEWYADAYRSSSDPAALVECLYHRVMAVAGRTQAICPYADEGEHKEDLERYRWMITLVSLVQLSKALSKTQSEARRHPELAFRLGEDWAPGLSTLLGLQNDPPLIQAKGRQVDEEVRNLFRIVHKERGESYKEVLFNEREAGSIPVSEEVTQQMPKATERQYEAERELLRGMIVTTVERMTPEGMTPMDPFDGEWSEVRKVQAVLLKCCPFEHPARTKVWQEGIHAMAKYHYQLARNALLQAKKSAFDLCEKEGMDERGFRISPDASDPAYRWLLEAIESAGIAHRISWLLPLEDLDFQLHVNLRSSTSSCLAFARLGRFAEAHRVLNLASGYLRIMSARDSAIERGRLMLRRAEIFFLQARSKGIGKHDLHAHLNDALYWVRQGADCVLKGTQHGQWLNLALMLEAEIIQVCVYEEVPVAGGRGSALGHWEQLLKLAAQLVPNDPVASRRQKAMKRSMEAWFRTRELNYAERPAAGGGTVNGV